jgi:hypothetical protein
LGEEATKTGSGAIVGPHPAAVKPGFRKAVQTRELAKTNTNWERQERDATQIKNEDKDNSSQAHHQPTQFY